MTKFKIVDWAVNTAAFFVIVIAFYTIGPWVETKWFPVYSKFRIVSIEPYGDDNTQSLVTFEFTKYRACEPQGFAWFFGEPGSSFRQLKADIKDKTASIAIRPLGKQLSRQYVMDATPLQITTAAFAEIYNRCHPFWLTRSEIYP